MAKWDDENDKKAQATSSKNARGAPNYDPFEVWYMKKNSFNYSMFPSTQTEKIELLLPNAEIARHLKRYFTSKLLKTKRANQYKATINEIPSTFSFKITVKFNQARIKAHPTLKGTVMG